MAIKFCLYIYLLWNGRKYSQIRISLCPIFLNLFSFWQGEIDTFKITSVQKLTPQPYQLKSSPETAHGTRLTDQMKEKRLAILLQINFVINYMAYINVKAEWCIYLKDMSLVCWLAIGTEIKSQRKMAKEIHLLFFQHGRSFYNTDASDFQWGSQITESDPNLRK